MSEKMTIGEGAVALVAMFCFDAGLFAWHGFVATRLWVWHAVPLGAPPIPLGHGIGLVVLAALLTYKAPPKDYDVFRAAAMGLLMPLAFLAFGWVFA